MHIIEIQYISNYSNKTKNTDMHDLSTIYSKVKTSLKCVAKDCFEFGDNHRLYPNPPKMTDLEIISLSITAEAVDIGSENLLWSKLKTDYSSLIPHLIHRTSYNRRRKALSDVIQECTIAMSDLIDEKSPCSTLIIDSIPIPTCKIVREKSSVVCRDPIRDEVVASKSYNPIFKNYYIGYKLHLICSDSGVFRDMLISSAHVHDNAFLKLLGEKDEHLAGHNLLGDRAYIGQAIQLSLFEEIRLNIQVPYRRNQKDYKKYDHKQKIKRKNIEVVFAQYCDEFSLRKNYAKRFDGFFVRIQTKIAAKTFKQYWNMINGNPINQTKHSLAA